MIMNLLTNLKKNIHLRCAIKHKILVPNALIVSDERALRNPISQL